MFFFYCVVLWDVQWLHLRFVTSVYLFTFIVYLCNFFSFIFFIPKFSLLVCEVKERGKETTRPWRLCYLNKLYSWNHSGKVHLFIIIIIYLRCFSLFYELKCIWMCLKQLHRHINHKTVTSQHRISPLNPGKSFVSLLSQTSLVFDLVPIIYYSCFSKVFILGYAKIIFLGFWFSKLVTS